MPAIEGKHLRTLDRFVGKVLYWGAFIFLLLFPKNTKGNILAIKLWALGDTIDILPSLAALKKIYPEKKLIVLCTKNNGFVFRKTKLPDKVLALDIKNPGSILKKILTLRRSAVSICVDFEPFSYFSAAVCAFSGAGTRIGFSNRKLLYTKSIRPEHIHIVHNYFNLIRTIKNMPYPKLLEALDITLEDDKNASLLLPKGRIIGIHAGSSSSSTIRRWKEENFAKFIDAIASRYDVKIIITGTENEKDIAERIARMTKYPVVSIAGKTTVGVLCACLKRMSLFIANDSGPMHLAAAMGTPTIGLFGPNVPELYGPYGKNNIGIYKGPHTPYIKPFIAEFPEKYKEEYDVNRISVADVLIAARKILENADILP